MLSPTKSKKYVPESGDSCRSALQSGSSKPPLLLQVHDVKPSFDDPEPLQCPVADSKTYQVSSGRPPRRRTKSIVQVADSCEVSSESAHEPSTCSAQRSG